MLGDGHGGMSGGALMAFAAHINLPLSARNEAMRHKGEMLHQGDYHITVCAICAGCDVREVPGARP